jgi:hypothetical protein
LSIAPPRIVSHRSSSWRNRQQDGALEPPIMTRMLFGIAGFLLSAAVQQCQIIDR